MPPILLYPILVVTAIIIYYGIAPRRKSKIYSDVEPDFNEPYIPNHTPTKKQRNDRQVYAAVRAMNELMKIDGDIDPGELTILGAFGKYENQKLMGQFNKNSEESKFVWYSEGNFLETLKTFSKEQVDFFYKSLIFMAGADGDLKDAEVDYIVKLYENFNNRENNYADSLSVVRSMIIETLPRGQANTSADNESVELSEDNKVWLGVIDMRVNAMSVLNGITNTVLEMHSGDPEDLGLSHCLEYSNNDYQIPKSSRKQIAKERVKGLMGISDYINIHGSEDQKFHFKASLIGARCYAKSIGIDISSL